MREERGARWRIAIGAWAVVVIATPAVAFADAWVPAGPENVPAGMVQFNLVDSYIEAGIFISQVVSTLPGNVTGTGLPSGLPSGVPTTLPSGIPTTMSEELAKTLEAIRAILPAGANATTIASDPQLLARIQALLPAGISLTQILAALSTSSLPSGVPTTLPTGVPLPTTVATMDDSQDALCLQVGTSPCADDTKALRIQGVLPYCQSPAQEWCIESVSIYRDGTPATAATFLSAAPGPTYAANSAWDLPALGTVTRMRAPGVPHAGGSETYAAYAYIEGYVAPDKRTLVIQAMNAAVTPYTEISGAKYKTPENAVVDVGGRKRIVVSNAYSECVWAADGSCGRVQDFAADSRATMTMRMGNTISGWLMGRMKDPKIAVESFSARQNRVTVDAATVAVPRLSVEVPRSTGDAALRRLLPDAPATFVATRTNQRNAFDWISALTEPAKDQAAGSVTAWSFATTANGSGSSCLQDTTRLLGLVTTNSMVYEGTAPRFVDSTLDYKVAGLHRNPDGSTFLGTYDLVMRSDTARCLYGFSKAPVSATINITDDKGEQRVATTVLSEADGWLRLGAYGFTFSAPTLRVRLTGTKEQPTPTPTPSVTPTPTKKPSTPAASARTTITCVKGKVVRKVTAMTPKCPAGFKKRT